MAHKSSSGIFHIHLSNYLPDDIVQWKLHTIYILSITKEMMVLKRYLLTGGAAAVLLLGACGDGETEEPATVEDESPETKEEAEELRAENESLQERIAELEEENDVLTEIVDNTEEEPEEEVEEEEITEESTSTGEGTRSNPLQIGDTAQLEARINGDDFDERYEASVDLTVNEIIIGEEAYNMLVEENQFNDPAPEGYQWALIHATSELVEAETEDYAYYVMDRFEIVEEDGSSAPRESAVTPDSYEGDHIYSGGTSSGYVSALVPAEGAFLIKYDAYPDSDVFFEVD